MEKSFYRNCREVVWIVFFEMFLSIVFEHSWTVLGLVGPWIEIESNHSVYRHSLCHIETAPEKKPSCSTYLTGVLWCSLLLKYITCTMPFIVLSLIQYFTSIYAFSQGPTIFMIILNITLHKLLHYMGYVRRPGP